MTLFSAMKGNLETATEDELLAWKGELLDEVRAPTLRTLAWTDRRTKLDQRFAEIVVALMDRRMHGFPPTPKTVVDGSGREWTQLALPNP